MSDVYVSSTFRDLRSCRRDVEEAVRLLGHRDVAMEHYGAEPRPPLQRCLKDVAECDIYLGIFGRRYGWVPPGATESITEQEYRQALLANKDILVFLLDEDTQGWPEPEEEPDERKAQLAKLRRELSGHFLAPRFASCQELAIKVIASLANLDGPRVTPGDFKREDDLLMRMDKDPSTASQCEQALVDMGSAAYAATLRRRLREPAGSQERRMAEVGQLVAIARHNYRVMPILLDLLGADDPRTRAAVVFKIGERALGWHRVTDDDIRTVLALASDPSAAVRREVGHAMWKFLPRDSAVRDEMLKKLVALVRDPDESVRKVSEYSGVRVMRGYP